MGVIMKRFFLLLFLVLVSGLFLTLSGCRIVKVEDMEKAPLSYTIPEQEELPRQLKELIEEKKKKEFQMTYQRGDDLYLVKGYGQQLSGGYSIQIEELGTSENAVFFKTILIGPGEQEQGSTPSYPCIVVKTEYRKGTVIFY